MSGEKELLLSLPLDNKEREWMKERAQNLNCYDMVLAGQEKAYGQKKMEQLITQSADPVITPDCVRPKEYGLSLLEQEGYVLNTKGTAYIRRNSQEFYFEHTAPRTEPGVTMN